MTVDPHASEPTADIPGGLWAQYQEVKKNVEGWNQELERLQEKIKEHLGDAYAGKVNGIKVVTYRPTATYSVNGIKRDYAELVQHFEHEVVRTEFDLNAFVAQHEEIAEKYRSRSFRLVG